MNAHATRSLRFNTHKLVKKGQVNIKATEKGAFGVGHVKSRDWS